MNKRRFLSMALVLALVVTLFAGCSPDEKKGAESDAVPAPQEQVTEPLEEQPLDGEETPAEGETEPEDEGLLLVDGGDLEIVVPDDQAIGGF